MEKVKKVLMVVSFVAILIGLAASVWLYTVLHDGMSMAMMVVFLLALIWYGANVWRTLGKN